MLLACLLAAVTMWFNVTAAIGASDSPDTPVPLTWEIRTYAQDERLFLEKFQEVVASMETYPFQWLGFPGANGAYFEDNAYVTHADAMRFYEFGELARTATDEDLRKCAAYLDKASPKEQVMILILLHLSLDDKWLLLIAQYIDDYGVPFPHLSQFTNYDRRWRLQQYGHARAYHERLVQIARWKQRRGEPLSPFEIRVLRHYTTDRWEPPHVGPKTRYSFMELKYVSDYALAILALRGCGMVDSMRQMYHFRSVNQSPELSALVAGFGEHEAPLAVQDVFSDKAWKEFQAMPFNVRCICPNIRTESRCEAPCISKWKEYVRRIPKEEIVELLTSPNLEGIDADLDLDHQHELYLGYRPYLGAFWEYVCENKNEWFSESEYAEIRPQVRLPLR